jgi:hypothetical protein
MKKTVSKIAMAIAITALGLSSASAQTNLGADCGCPTISNRTTTVNLSSLADVNGNLIATNTVLTCDKRYVLDAKIYVGAGKSLTINPGTAIFANVSAAGTANALIISRDAKIFAAGTESCPIVFTVTGDAMDGSFATPFSQWGGVVLLGRATNNLTSATCGSLYEANGLGRIEGFIGSDPRIRYGADLAGTFGPAESFDDNDNSGIMRYVSIRYGGATVANNNELNGLTMGSVGRGTTVEYVEIVGNSDDGFEWFGGTVNCKNIAVFYSDDDQFDWDHGYSGKLQFLYALMAGRGDHGFEIDSDDSNCGTLPLSQPVVYNATIIGRNNAGDFGIEAKENTGGFIRNSIIANFVGAIRINQNNATNSVYNNWTATPARFLLENNTFVACGTDLTGSGFTVAPADITRLTDAGNTFAPTLNGFDFTHVYNLTANANVAVTDQVDPTPNPAVTSATVPPADGFFTPVNYRGAFASSGLSWLKNWSWASYVDATNGLVPCPNDVNNDGIVNITDFNSVLGAFGTSCD